VRTPRRRRPPVTVARRGGRQRGLRSGGRDATRLRRPVVGYVAPRRATAARAAAAERAPGGAPPPRLVAHRGVAAAAPVDEPAPPLLEARQIGPREGARGEWGDHWTATATAAGGGARDPRRGGPPRVGPLRRPRRNQRVGRAPPAPAPQLRCAAARAGAGAHGPASPEWEGLAGTLGGDFKVAPRDQRLPVQGRQPLPSGELGVAQTVEIGVCCQSRQLEQRPTTGVRVERSVSLSHHRTQSHWLMPRSLRRAEAGRGRLFCPPAGGHGSRGGGVGIRGTKFSVYSTIWIK